MKKLLRFIIVSLLFVVTLMLFYSLLPAIVWIFGGSFTYVSQSAPYVAFSVLIIIPIQGIIFSECFDKNFYPKD